VRFEKKHSDGLHVFLEREYVRRLDQFATTRGVSKAEVIAAALSSYFSLDDGRPKEWASAPRLDKVLSQLEQLERGQTLLIETLAFFIRDYLAGTAPILEPHQEAARTRGRVRFGQFIEQLALYLQRDSSFVQELEQEFAPDASRVPPKDTRTASIRLQR